MIIRLTGKDREELIGDGFMDDDIQDVEDAIPYTKYYAFKFGGQKHEISMAEAIKILGWDSFLFGIAESSLDRSSTAYNDDTGDGVYFDSSEYFKKNYEYDSDYYDWD